MQRKKQISLVELHQFIGRKLKEYGYTDYTLDLEEYYLILRIHNVTPESNFSNIGFSIDKYGYINVGLLDKNDIDVGGEDREETKFYPKASYALFCSIEDLWLEIRRLYQLATSNSAYVPNTIMPVSPITPNQLSDDHQQHLKQLKQQLSTARLDKSGLIKRDVPDPVVAISPVINEPSSDHQQQLAQLKQQASAARLEKLGLIETASSLNAPPLISILRPKPLPANEARAIMDAYLKIYYIIRNLDKTLGIRLTSLRTNYPRRHFKQDPVEFLNQLNEHTKNKPNSRSALAYELAKKHYANLNLDPHDHENFNYVLFHELYRQDINKRYFKISRLNGIHFFQSAILQSSFTPDQIERAAHRKGSRTATICDMDKCDENTSLHRRANR